MSDQDTNQGGLPFSGGIAIFIALIAGYAFIDPSTLESVRPDGNNLQLKRSYGPEDVQARLWQDPFLAVQQHIKTSSTHIPPPIKLQATLQKDDQGTITKSDISQAPETPPYVHTLTALNDEIRHKAKQSQHAVKVLAIMISAGPYSEQSEQRLRNRYAVISALATSDYQPEDAQHIGFVRTAKHTGNGKNALPPVIPYEWYKARENGQHVILIWLDEDAFAYQPLVKLGRLTRLLTQHNPAAIGEISLIGPNSSGTLSAMRTDLKHLSQEHSTHTPAASEQTRDNILQLKKRVTFLSATATVANSELDLKKGTSLSGLFKSAGIDFNRTITTDDQLATQLVDELSLRIPMIFNYFKDSSYQVAIVSEWDTLYGRALPRAFSQALCNQYQPKDCQQFQQKNIYQFSYMRGIDGQIAAPENNTKNMPPNSPKNQVSASSIELPTGKSQKDYLRRLAMKIDATDLQLRNNGEKGIRAIGILGSDVYDKLLVLQALREHFPKAIFFTTDLDASMIHPDNIPWTRNMISASSFGLQLNDHIQRDIPPFRDSYQTSVHLATLIALNKSIAESFQSNKDKFQFTPNIYEIDRFGFVRLEQNLTQHKTSDQHAVPLHPKESTFISSRHITLICSLFALLLLLVFVVWKQWGNENNQVEINLKSESIALSLTAFILLMLFLAWKYLNLNTLLLYLTLVAIILVPIIYAFIGLFQTKRRSYHRLNPDLGHLTFSRWAKSGAHDISHKYLSRSVLLFMVIVIAFPIIVISSVEPFSINSGISIWPTEIVRLFAFGLSFILLNHGWNQLQRNSLDIEEALNISPQSTETTNHIDQESCHINDLWGNYQRYGSPENRFKRVLLQSIIWTGLCMTLYLFQTPNIPFRGEVAYWADIIIASGACIIFIFMFVFLIDSALYCRKMIIQPMCTKTILWPQTDTIKDELSILHDIRSLWLNVNLIGMHTTVVSRSVLYPVYIILLLFAAQNAYFDHWNLPVPLILIACINITIVLLTAFMLRRGAITAKTCSLTKLDDIEGNIPQILKQEVERRASEDEKDTWEQNIRQELESTREKIKAINSGAFMPIASQPWLKALTLFGSGGGGLLLIEYMSRIN